MTAPLQTHDVDNQPPEFSGRDLWTDDIALREGVEREGAASFRDAVQGYGTLAGGELLRLSFDAHRDRPRLRTHDGFGHRLDVVEFDLDHNDKEMGIIWLINISVCIKTQRRNEKRL